MIRGPIVPFVPVGSSLLLAVAGGALLCVIGAATMAHQANYEVTARRASLIGIGSFIISLAALGFALVSG